MFKPLVRRLSLTAAGLLVIVLIVVVGVFVWLDSLAKTAIEQGATFALGLQTRLDEADLQPLAGRGALRGLRIVNPKGFDAEHFLAVRGAAMELSLSSLMTDVIRLPLLSLEGIEIALERKPDGANYDVVLANLRRFESSKDTAAPPSKTGFIIDEIVIRDITVRVDLVPEARELSRTEVHIPEIRLSGIGSDSDKGVILAQVSDTLVTAVLTAAVKNGGRLIPAVVIGELDKSLNQLGSVAGLGVKVVGDVVGQTVEGVGKAVGKVVEEAGKGVEGAAKGIEGAAKEIGKGAEQVLEGLGGLLGPKKNGDKKGDAAAAPPPPQGSE